MRDKPPFDVQRVCETLEDYIGNPVLCRYLDNNPGEKPPYCDIIEGPYQRVDRSAPVHVVFRGISIPLGEEYIPNDKFKAAIADIVTKDGEVLFRNEGVLKIWLDNVLSNARGLQRIRREYHLER